MNFHTYGNMWIHPFNYLKKAKLYPEFLEQKYTDFYESFGEQIKSVTKSKYGNAIEMVSYSTDGEASDWMLGERGIVSFSPELGSFNPDAQTFFIPKSLIYSVIQENFKVVNEFMKRGTFNITNLAYGVLNDDKFYISFKNDSFSRLKNVTFKIFTQNPLFLEYIKGVSFQNQYSDLIKIEEFDIDEVLQRMVFQVPKIEQLEGFNLFIKFDKEGLQYLNMGTNFDIQIVLQDLELAGYFQIMYSDFMSQLGPKSKYYLLSMFGAGIMFSVVILLMVKMFLTFWRRHIRNQRRPKGEVSVNTERQESHSSGTKNSSQEASKKSQLSEGSKKDSIKNKKTIRLSMPTIEEENTQDEK